MDMVNLGNFGGAFFSAYPLLIKLLQRDKLYLAALYGAVLSGTKAVGGVLWPSLSL